MLSRLVLFEHGAKPVGHFYVVKSGLVALTKEEPPRLPHTIMLSNVCIANGIIGCVCLHP